MTININLSKAKAIAHELRRRSRDAEFAPYDTVIMKQIPGNDFTQVEAARQAIRDKYAQIQTNIDAAENVVQLKQILDTFKTGV